MEKISPKAVLSEIAEVIPEDCKQNIIIIGSLAVGYHFFSDNEDMAVRTKDADCLLSPRVAAVRAGKAITEQLFDFGWTLQQTGDWSKPGTKDTPLSKLPAVRLCPPGKTDWFIELLSVPDLNNHEKEWTRLETNQGHFGLPSFGFLSLVGCKPLDTPLGIKIARPEMMALANMLEHPQIGTETMSGLIQNRKIKRSNKDLGRVLAISFLSNERDEDALLEWPDKWKEALDVNVPDCHKLIHKLGQGIQLLLDSEPDLDEAHHTCVYGLLASRPPSLEQLKIAGQRLLQDSILPLQNSF